MISEKESRKIKDEIKRERIEQHFRQVETQVMPPIPSKWKSRQNGTRHVVDRTLGRDVVYFKGRLPADSWGRWGDRCTLEEWAEYQKTARRVA